MRYLQIAACACLLTLGACKGAAPPPKEDDALSWAQEPMPPSSNGSLFQPGREAGLFENPVARHIGDIVTIVLNEQTAAQKSAVTTTTKTTTDTLPGMTLLGNPVSLHGNLLTNNNINDASKFDGEGTSQQSNSLTGFVTVTVVRVLPNGNLFVKGEKWIGINQGKEYVQLSGVVRPMDLASDNSISSSKVANAHITYSGKGTLNDANSMGWLARFFNSPWSLF
jgi:flagellar L-ring protein FlgH